MTSISETLRDLAQRFGWKLLKLLISFALLTWLVLRFDWGEVITTIGEVPAWMILLAFTVYVSGQLFSAHRLQILLHAQHIQVSYFYTIRLTFLALFSGNFLPSTVGGDAVKVVTLTRQGHRLDQVAATLVIDRLINIAAMLIFVPSVLWVELPETATFGLTLPQFNTTQWGLALLIIVIGLSVVYKILLLSKQTASWVLTIQTKVGNIFKNLLTIAQRWVDQPIVILRSFVLSWLSLLTAFLTAWIVAKGLQIDGNLIEITGIEVIVYFISLLPISINGWGVQEVGRLQFLAGVGATSSQGLALAVLMRLLFFGTSLLGAFELLTDKQVKEE